jgi:hypothetical protein
MDKGIWVLVVGIITSILIGIVKTPIRKKLITTELDEAVRINREHIFDTAVFLGTFVFAFLGAMCYYLIVTKTFVIGDIANLSLSVWLAQSMVYGIWKKLGLKRLLQLLLKLIIKDKNKDGQISLDEAVIMVREAFKNGKLDVNALLKETVDNASENLEKVLVEATKEVEVDKNVEAVKVALEGDYSALTETIKESAETLAKEAEKAKSISKEEPAVLPRNIII